MSPIHKFFQEHSEKKFRLYGKKFYYACDLSIQVSKYCIFAQGNVRFGLKQSEVRLESQWTKGLTFSEYSLKAPGIQYWLDAKKRQDKKLQVSSSQKGNIPLEVPWNSKFYDPLSAVMIQVFNSRPPMEMHSFSSSRSVLLQRKGNVLFKDGRQWLEVISGSHGGEVRIPILKMNLKIE